MKFAFHIPDPQSKVDSRSIPGGERNVNGETYQEHFNAGGIIAFSADFREAGLPIKTYAAFHIIHNGEFGISATKRNRLQHRSYKVESAITDLPFVKRPFISDVMLTSMLMRMWGLLEGGKSPVCLRTKPNLPAEPCLTMSADYTELVKSLRSWPTRFDVNEDVVKATMADLQRAMSISGQAGFQGPSLHKQLARDMGVASGKIVEAIQLRSITNVKENTVS